MAKGFKLRISFPSFQICRSKKSSSMPKSPSAVKPVFTPYNPKMFEITYPKSPPPPPPPSTPDHPLSKRTLSKVLSFGSTGCVSKLSTAHLSSLCYVDSPAYKMMKDYESFRKHCNSPAYSEDLEESVIMRPRSKDLATSFSMSFSSADSNWFSSEDYDQKNEESEVLLSSCSSLDNSYDFGYSITNEIKPTYESKRKKRNTKDRRLKRCASNGRKDGGEQRITIAAMAETDKSEAAAGKKKGFRRLVPCAVDGKVNDSYAVMKKSSDPYEDFKKSMMEMILENEISEPDELEKLLICFRTLNASEHHEAIVEAFTEVWEELFCE